MRAKSLSTAAELGVLHCAFVLQRSGLDWSWIWIFLDWMDKVVVL